MKLVAIDMDGTLLHSEKYVSDYTAEVVQRMKHEGHSFVIATGRSLDDAKEIVTKADIPAEAYVCANGAVIAEGNGKILKEEHLHINTATNIASWLNERHFYFHLATSNGIYATDDAYQFFLNDLHEYVRTQPNSEVLKEGIRDQADQHLKDIGLQMLPAPEDIPSHRFTAYKFLVLSLFPERLQMIRDAWENDGEINITSSGRDNLEIMPAEVGKGSGLQYIAEHLGIALENTVAIGDNYNDLSMFKTAGLSIAMGNAETEVKKITHTTTDDNDNDGVATAIEKHILKRNTLI
ncbi:hypothetical protein HNR44_003250 [Geomicrobium halophilum]|uniref:Cof subfamily of IIB subfamily of haloacid dehalogenase superfamily/HAD-superfamily hydrolase, subfamily IIB n=1 Tax=Geomicrobium halophilum TaxID=549000 RepID=A0A841PVN1_9BACL|nr:Cof-type HAD-IIB family hydrolase [Geomicrobium halophilum]MBB6451256.1 hypothetical protein [Geomicrobium halophilum]